MSFWSSHLAVLAAARDLVDCKHDRLNVAGEMGRICLDCGARYRPKGREWERPPRTERLAQALLEHAERFRNGSQAALAAVASAWKGMRKGGDPKKDC